MKETYIGPAYGLGNWHKTDIFTRSVYDFSDKKTFGDRLIEFAIQLGFLAAIALVVSLFT